MGDRPGVSHCQMYLMNDSDSRRDERFCKRGGHWRPANIPMRSEDWFCKHHARKIAEREGVYGIYRIDDQSYVEELPLPKEES